MSICSGLQWLCHTTILKKNYVTFYIKRDDLVGINIMSHLNMKKLIILMIIELVNQVYF